MYGRRDSSEWARLHRTAPQRSPPFRPFRQLSGWLAIGIGQMAPSRKGECRKKEAGSRRHSSVYGTSFTAEHTRALDTSVCAGSARARVKSMYGALHAGSTDPGRERRVRRWGATALGGSTGASHSLDCANTVSASYRAHCRRRLHLPDPDPLRQRFELHAALRMSHLAGFSVLVSFRIPCVTVMEALAYSIVHRSPSRRGCHVGQRSYCNRSIGPSPSPETGVPTTEYGPMAHQINRYNLAAARRR